ncbi:hypothetical protein JCM8097_005680 [Rhodosporidiobolus ruineniae]
MLDRLPPEILDAILVLTYPPSPWPDKDDVDKERRQSVTKLSLVCKAVSVIAQDLLWRKVSIVSEDLDVTRRLQKLKTPLKAKVRTTRTSSHVALQEMLVVMPQCSGARKLQFSSNLAKQLDMIQISNLEYGLWADEPPSTTLWTLPTAILDLIAHELFSALHCPEPIPVLASHVHIVVAPDSDLTSDALICEDIEILIACITLPNSLKSLVLPSFLRRLDYSMTLSRSKRDDLLKTCTAKKVDVVWHDEEAELSFSRALSAYAKRLKAEAVEAGEVVQEASAAA